MSSFMFCDNIRCGVNSRQRLFELYSLRLSIIFYDLCFSRNDFNVNLTLDTSPRFFRAIAKERRRKSKVHLIELTQNCRRLSSRGLLYQICWYACFVLWMILVGQIFHMSHYVNSCFWLEKGSFNILADCFPETFYD